MSERKRCFPPVVDVQTRILILGSLPSDASLAQQQYYAHPQNRFWWLLGETLGLPLVSMAYPDRLSTLRANGIGLWDVIAEAQRRGSLDASIRGETGNDLRALIDTLPALAVIAFNGKTAERIGSRQLGLAARRLQLISLPSSSPAHTMKPHHKLAQWQPLRDYVDRATYTE